MTLINTTDIISNESKTVMNELVQRLNTLKKERETLEKELNTQKEKLEALEKNEVLDDSESVKRQELKYQKFMDKTLYNDSHPTSQKQIDFNFQDKNTLNVVKCWTTFDEALGLFKINHAIPRKCVYFFGYTSYPERRHVINLFKSMNISIYEFVDNENGTDIDIDTIYEVPNVKINNPNKKIKLNKRR